MGKAIRQYVADAFTDRVFSGNPAAVCVLDEWLPEWTMQAMACENGLSETAFLVPEEPEGPRAGVPGSEAAPLYRLRWFTPGGEIDLCGHATLASAYVLGRFYQPEADELQFDTLSGKLSVRRDGELLRMDFPAYELRRAEVTDAMEEALGARPTEALLGRDLLCVFGDERAVRAMEPDQEALKGLDGLLCHVTAPGSGGYDCVSRSFAPKLAVAEDPVCGSGHCHIAPYWAAHLGKADLVAYQASKRGGTLFCHVGGGRVELAGKAALYSEAEVFVGE